MPRSDIENRRRAALEDGSAPYIARRQQIIQAAAHVFRERGSETRLRDIADALGTDRASLYYYVGSKEELLQEIVREALDRDLSAARAVRRSRATSLAKIRALIRSMVMSYSDNYPHIHVYVEDLSRLSRQTDDAWAETVLQQARDYEAVVRAIIAKGVEDGSLRPDLHVDVATMALFGMVNWMHRWYRPSYPVPPQEIASTFAEIYLGGYANRDSSAEPAAGTPSPAAEQ